MAHIGAVTLPRPDNGKSKTNGADEVRETADFKRVHVIFPQAVYAKLQLMARRKGVTLTEALRQAIYLSDHIERAIQEEHATVVIDRQGDKSAIVIP